VASRWLPRRRNGCATGAPTVDRSGRTPRPPYVNVVVLADLLKLAPRAVLAGSAMLAGSRSLRRRFGAGSPRLLTQQPRVAL
jgi:hypothetical protein